MICMVSVNNPHALTYKGSRYKIKKEDEYYET